jgi:hypothetical protein
MMYANYTILRKAQTVVSFFWHHEAHASSFEGLVAIGSR